MLMLGNFALSYNSWNGIVFGIVFSGNYIDICFIPRNMKPEEAYQCCLQAMQILPVLLSLLHCCFSLFLSLTYTHTDLVA